MRELSNHQLGPCAFAFCAYSYARTQWQTQLVCLWVQLFYPKQTDKPLYKGLVTQLKSLNIPMPSIDEVKLKPLREQYDLVVDSIFGFGFTGAPRPPFDKIIEVCCNPSAPLSNFAQY